MKPVGRPPLAALSNDAVGANGRTVAHLMTTASDGLIPRLIADDFAGKAPLRAKAVDLLAQLRERDPDRAKTVRDKARALLDDMVDDHATERAENIHKTAERLKQQSEDDDDGPDEPPYDPDHPRPGDPDDPDEDDPDEPGEPDEPPKKPKPDCDDLILAVSEASIAHAEAVQRQTEISAKIGKVYQKIGELNGTIRDLEFELAAAATGGKISRIPHFGAKVIGTLSTAAAVELRAQLLEARNQLKDKQKEMEDLKAELETAKTETEARERELEAEKARLDKCKKGEKSG